MRKKILLLVLSLLPALSATAQSITAHKALSDNGYDYWFHQPANADSIKPLIVFMHGASLCGRNLHKVKRYGTIDAIERGRKVDAYVIAPQNPGGAWEPRRVMEIVEWAQDNYNIDRQRIYVLGMSLGGYGTIDFCATYHHKVAAGIAMCGGGTVRNYERLNALPMWIIHGTADRAVSVRMSDAVVKEMREAEGGAPRLQYDRVKGMNHSALARAFYKKEIYEWLFAHTLADSTRAIAPTCVITNATLRGAYSDLDFSIRRRR